MRFPVDIEVISTLSTLIVSVVEKIAVAEIVCAEGGYCSTGKLTCLLEDNLAHLKASLERGGQGTEKPKNPV